MMKIWFGNAYENSDRYIQFKNKRKLFSNRKSDSTSDATGFLLASNLMGSVYRHNTVLFKKRGADQIDTAQLDFLCIQYDPAIRVQAV